MKSRLYTEAIKQGWKVSWRHKSLWTYGLFAAFLGQMGISELVVRVGTASSGDLNQFSGFYYLNLFGEMFKKLWQGINISNGVWLAVATIFVGGIAAAFVYVVIASQGALVKSASLLYKKDKDPDFHATWHAGTKHFWRLAMVQFLRKTILLSLILIVSAGSLNAVYGRGLSDNLIFLALFILVCLAGAVMSFLSIYATGYIVVEEYHLFEALKEAWKLFVKHWLVSLEIAAIMLIINIGIILVAVCAVLLIFSPVAILWAVSVWTGKYIFFGIGTILSSILTFIAAAIMASVFTVFVNSVWTFLFMKMHHVGIKSKIVHWLKS